MKHRQVSQRRPPSFLLKGILYLFSSVCCCTNMPAADWQADARLLQSKPDIYLKGNYEFNAKPAVADALLKSPMLVARLWEAFQFTPKYKARLQGDAIHVDDPTGIEGDLYPVEQAANRRLWVGVGNLNHNLVPSFRGKIALVLTTAPKGAGLSARLDLYIRTESRMLGLLASTFFPLVKTRAEHRMTANATDIGTILAEVSSDPQKAAQRLPKEDASALLKLVAPAPAPAQAAAAKPPAAPAAGSKRTAAKPSKRP